MTYIVNLFNSRIKSIVTIKSLLLIVFILNILIIYVKLASLFLTKFSIFFVLKNN